MKTFIGIDLGSTTTKAIVLDSEETVLGRGITNSRSNYGIAADVAKQEAFLDARFFLFRKLLQDLPALGGLLDEFLASLEQDFRLQQYLDQLGDLERTCIASAGDDRLGRDGPETRELLSELFRTLQEEAPKLFVPRAHSTRTFRSLSSRTAKSVSKRC
jgi:benzoyl-CoA reductase subunit A